MVEMVIGMMMMMMMGSTIRVINLADWREMRMRKTFAYILHALMASKDRECNFYFASARKASI